MHMTQDEIIELGIEAELCDEFGTINFEYGYRNEIIAFAKLVAEREREACAKICEDGINNATEWDSGVWDQACENRAFAIRARGQA
jgi:hypothetical protein